MRPARFAVLGRAPALVAAVLALPLATPVHAQPTPPPSASPTPAATPTAGPTQAPPATAPTYDLSYDVRIVPTERVARVTIRLDRNQKLLEMLRMRIDPQRHFRFEGDGEIEVDDEKVVWRPPSGSGELRYSVRLDHLHDSVGYDARSTDKWALFRGEDVVPPIATAGDESAHSNATLRLRVPVGWDVVTPFPGGSNGTLDIEQPHRHLDRPTGWILTGKLDETREKIAGVSVTIAAPEGHGLRRLDILALLRWTLPALQQILGKLPPRLLIVGASDPMWRGGLSGPGSLYVHAAMPLISPDGTSPVLHELIHVATSARSADDGDWAVEGLAELYSLQLLLRSGTVSQERYDKSLAKLASRGRKVKRLRTEHASGAVTARAVVVLAELDATLRQRSEGRASLDDVLRALAAERRALSTESFAALVEETTGQDVADFFAQIPPAKD